MITVTSTQELAILLDSNISCLLTDDSSIRFYVDDKLVDFVDGLSFDLNKLHCKGLRDSDYSRHRVYNMQNFVDRKVRFDIVPIGEETMSQEDANFEPYIDADLGY